MIHVGMGDEGMADFEDVLGWQAGDVSGCRSNGGGAEFYPAQCRQSAVRNVFVSGHRRVWIGVNDTDWQDAACKIDWE